MKLISRNLIESLLKRAAESPRRRSHYNFHESPADPVQLYLIGARLGSYFRPHCHPTQGEFALVIRGAFELVTFDDSGTVLEKIRLGSGCDAMGFEIPAGIWHTWVVLEDDSVFLEVKPGPYDAATASTFAQWSAPEGDERAGEFMAALRRSRAGDKVACPCS
jgi:cupin fold WbuC family metalloprotein